MTTLISYLAAFGVISLLQLSYRLVKRLTFYREWKLKLLKAKEKWLYAQLHKVNNQIIKQNE